MLLGHENESQALIGIATRSPEVTRLLTAILANWKLSVTDDLRRSALALVEWGQTVPVPAERLLWLVPLPIDGPHLIIPLQLEALQQVVTERLFRTPRRNLRVALRHPAEVYLAGEQFAVELCSLSKRGARLSCGRALQLDQRLELTLRFGPQRLVLAGKVLYLLPSRDLSGEAHQEAGILFDFSHRDRAAATAHIVEALCLEAACRRAGISRSAPSTSWFAVPRAGSPLLPPDARL